MTWKQTTLRAAAEVILGRQRSPIHAEGPHMRPYLRAANVKDGSLDLTSVHSMNFSPQEQAVFSLRPGDVLVTEGSGSIGSVGATSVWRKEIDGVICFQNTLLRLRPRAGTDPNYLGWWARAAHASGLFASIASGANIYHISAERARALSICLPPLEEQRRIADFLDAETIQIDRLSWLRQKQLVLLAERYSTFISESATPGIGNDAVEGKPHYPWLPGRLAVARLGHFVKIQSGITVDSGRKVAADAVRLPYLRVANVQDGRIDLTEIKEIEVSRSMAARSTLRKGDVVITEANGNPDNLGRGAVWDGEIANMVHQNHIFALRPDRRFVLPEFLSLVLASLHGRNYFRVTSSQVGIATTSSSKIAAMPFPVMGVQKQEQVIAACEEMKDATESAVRALRKHLELLEERRRAVITAAVTGELDVTTARRS